MKRDLFVRTGCLLLLLGCTSNPLQKPERFAEVYTKVLIAMEVEADSTSPELGSPVTKSARADSVLRSLGVDRQQFEAAIKYFSERPERWQKVYAQVVKNLEEHAKTAGMGKN